MYAIIETGGKQYKVSEGDTVDVELLPDGPGEPIEFDKVLFFSNGDDIRCGAPNVPGVRVIGVVAQQKKAKKIIVRTMKRHKGYHRKKGHRQRLTSVKVNRIVAS
jgi:large subunit ribosomal protein L21